MSGNNENRQVGNIYRAPMPVVAAEGPQNQDVEQPRQPHNLQGLLRFAMDSTKAEDGTTSSQFATLDEERKKFLEDALKSMTVDVIEKLQNCIKTLQGSDKLNENSDISEQIEAFETILEHVDMIDTAVDFHKIGGFTIFPPCLISSNPRIRAMACSVLAECTQNNPYCQTVVIDTDLLEHLLSVLDRDTDINVQTKALYAISCSIRENKEATDKFILLSGLKIVVKVLKNGGEKSKLKAAFLLGRLASSSEQVRDSLVSLNTIPIICHLIPDDSHSAHEHLLSLLWELVNNNSVAIDICTEPEIHLKNILKDHLIKCEGKEECIEEIEYCKNLLKILENIMPNLPETDR